MDRAKYRYTDFNYSDYIDEDFMKELKTHVDPISEEEKDKIREYLSDKNKNQIYHLLNVNKECWESYDRIAWLHGLNEEDRNTELENIRITENIYKEMIRVAPEKTEYDIAWERMKAVGDEWKKQNPELCKKKVFYEN